jgi:hypothetical protein
MSEMPPDALVERANDAIGSADAVQSLHVAEIKLLQEQIKAAGLANDLNERLLASNKDSLAIATKQLAASEKANSLTLDLLVSNEEAKVQDEKNANSMNAATQELASSTKWLKWATWALVLFTAVQAIIALIALFKK